MTHLDLQFAQAILSSSPPFFSLLHYCLDCMSFVRHFVSVVAVLAALLLFLEMTVSCVLFLVSAAHSPVDHVKRKLTEVLYLCWRYDFYAIYMKLMICCLEDYIVREGHPYPTLDCEDSLAELQVDSEAMQFVVVPVWIRPKKNRGCSHIDTWLKNHNEENSSRLTQNCCTFENWIEQHEFVELCNHKRCNF